MKILHVLHHSLPYLDGYSIRSKYIVEFQRKLGLMPILVTSAHHEIEVGHHISGTFQPKETIDELTYYRTQFPKGRLKEFQLQTPFFRERVLMKTLHKTIQRILSEERIDLIHAHSPVLCGIPALKAAARKIPFVYEVRAFWEEIFSEKSFRYRLGRYLETRLFRKVNAVIAISQRMMDDIVARGIDAEKVYKVPNGVDVNKFIPQGKDQALLNKYQLQGCTVFGFIGSFYRFEGLDCLIQAVAEIAKKVPSVRLILVGGGEEEDRIQQLIRQFQLSETVVFVGRVPHTEVLKYYSIMDILVYPRYSDRTTNLVTPLKPLEAMAMGKAVIGSDVGGVRELLDNGKVGLLFEAGNVNDLAEKITHLIGHVRYRQELGEKARRYTLEQRSWERIVPNYLKIYENVMSKA
ncbi:glycosyltransferase [Candidatus Poribacteria bacterium]|nr:glycosyltransferase [Candidatus Poribacteria bacterium]